MSSRSSVAACVALACFLIVLSAGAPRAQNLEQMAERWGRIKDTIQNLDFTGVSLNSNIRVVRKTAPFPHMIAEGQPSGDGAPPVRGYAFEETNRRFVIIQNLFGTSGAAVSPFNRVQLLEMLRSLLPRESFLNILEIEVVGFSDIQSFGDAFDIGACDVDNPHNNACLSISRAQNTAAILGEYTKRTLGERVHIESRADPDPIMNNLNVESQGKLWIATEAQHAATELAGRFQFESDVGAAMDADDIQRVRRRAVGAVFDQSDQRTLLQPFRCAIVLVRRR